MWYLLELLLYARAGAGYRVNLHPLFYPTSQNRKEINAGKKSLEFFSA